MSPQLISAIALLSLFGILATYKGAQHVSKSNKQVVSSNNPNKYTKKSHRVILSNKQRTQKSIPPKSINDEEFIALTREKQQKKFNSNFSQTQKSMNDGSTNGGKTMRRNRRKRKRRFHEFSFNE